MCAGARRTLLPRLTQWTLRRGERIDADTFSVVFPYASWLLPVLREAVTFRATRDGVLYFHGIIDRFQVILTKQGLLCTLEGRGPGAALQDNEQPSRTFAAATVSDILDAYVTPYGIQAICDSAEAAAYVGVLGGTALQALEEYCACAGLLPPRMLLDGQLRLAKARPSGGQVLYETQVLSAVLTEDPSQTIRRLYVSAKEGVTAYENPAGGRRVCWRSVPASRLPAAAYFAASMEQRRTVRLVLPGNTPYEPGETVQVKLPRLGLEQALAITQCTLLGDETGRTTELRLAER